MTANPIDFYGVGQLLLTARKERGTRMRTKTIRAIAPLAALLFFGCAAAPPTTPEDMRAASEPLYCQGDEQCALYWRRAQVWIAQNSEWKIQRADAVIIETFNPRGSSRSFGFKALREPQGAGRERITIAMVCDNVYGCNTSRETAAAAFKRYVKGAAP